MNLFEAKSDRGWERRADEMDLQNLYQAGLLHLDSQVRRKGSLNWFRVDEMFPHFEKIHSAKKYSVNMQAPPKAFGVRKLVLIGIAGVLLACVLFRFSQKIVDHNQSTTVSEKQR